MKKYITLFAMLAVVLLSGCSRAAITPDSNPKGLMDTILVYPLSHAITFVADFFHDNYGVAIIIVTLIVRFAVMPLMLKQMKSTMATQAIQPELVELQKKYSSKDTATQQKLQQETMALYQKHGVNPLAGCLPMLIQMPILMAFYYSISRTAEISNHSFLWFSLGQHDPYFILPVLAALTTLISMKITNSVNTSTNNNAMNKQMAMMSYLSPVLILFTGSQLPAALSLYWTVGGVVSIIQSLIIRNMKMKAKNGAEQTEFSLDGVEPH